MSKIEIKIEGMTCGHCASSVTKELEGISGVANISVDPKAGIASLEVDGVSNETLSAAIDEAGYKAVEFSTVG
jgi:copper chaperone